MIIFGDKYMYNLQDNPFLQMYIQWITWNEIMSEFWRTHYIIKIGGKNE